MSEARLARLLLAYGDARFGDEWWPIDARTWIGEEDAERLSNLIRNGIDDGEEAARLLDHYGEAKFGEKWRPDNAAAIVGDADGLDLPTLVAGIRQGAAPAFSAG